MNEAWNKAVKELQKISVDRSAIIKCEQWVVGGIGTPKGIRFSVYIENIGHSEWESTPGSAIRGIKNKMKIK